MDRPSKYLIDRAQNAPDLATAKAWILTAKSMFPADFYIQFEAFEFEKNARNYEEAAKCFSHLVRTFPNQPAELQKEIILMTDALRVPEEETTPAHQFYLKMFQHISYTVQQNILLITADYLKNNLDHCRLLILLMKRFPNTVVTHVPRLIDTLVQGGANKSPKFLDILFNEVLPMIKCENLELPPVLIHSLMALGLEYYTVKLLEPIDRIVIQDVWRSLFELFDICCHLGKWGKYTIYNKTWSKDIYWDNIIQLSRTATIVSPTVFATTIVLFMCLHEYTESMKMKCDSETVELCLVEGIIDKIETKELIEAETPVIDVPNENSSEIKLSFIVATHCWNLIHCTPIILQNFESLLATLTVSKWIAPFLIDMALFYKRSEDLMQLLNSHNYSSLVRSLKLLGSGFNNSIPLTHQMELIRSIIAELPTIEGNFIQNISNPGKRRHVIFLPMQKKTIVQYITKYILELIRPKLLSEYCPDNLLGHALVLLQLDWPLEQTMTEKIFSLIRNRENFTYLVYSKYIINIDIVEEFMSLWYTNCNLTFVPPHSTQPQRRIGTRGADKGVKEDFKQFMKQQVIRSEEDICSLVVHFIAHNLFVLFE